MILDPAHRQFMIGDYDGFTFGLDQTRDNPKFWRENMRWINFRLLLGLAITVTISSVK